MSDPSSAAPVTPAATTGAMASAAGGPAAAAAADRFARLTHFGGFDWATAEHQFVAVDSRGQVALSLRFANDARGWALFREKVAAFPCLGVAIETCCGPAVERLVDAGLAVYPMNPKAAERYRDRKAPSGAKDDALDAWSFAPASPTRCGPTATAGGRCWPGTR